MELRRELSCQQRHQNQIRGSEQPDRLIPGSQRPCDPEQEHQDETGPVDRIVHAGNIMGSIVPVPPVNSATAGMSRRRSPLRQAENDANAMNRIIAGRTRNVRS